MIWGVRRWPSDEGVAFTASAKLKLTFVGKSARDLENFFLLGLDFRKAHRAFRFEIFPEHFRSTLRHVLEHLFAQFLRGTLQCDDERIRLHFAQQQLDAAG